MARQQGTGGIERRWAWPALLTALLPVFVGSPLAAQPTGAASGPATAVADTTPSSEYATPPSKRVSWVVLPNAFYTPETRLAGGVAGQAVFRPRGDRRPSTVSGVVTLTQNKQVVSELLFERYVPGYRLSGKAGLTRWPDTFYGIGDGLPEEQGEAYTARLIQGHLEAQRRVVPALRVGVQADVRWERFLDLEAGGQLATGAVPGSASHRVVGLGLLADWDTRDNLFAARRGVFYRLAAVLHPRVLGSDFTMGKYLVDLRRYVPLGGSAVLALQGYGSFTAGTSPFGMLPMLGGARLMRGYRGARYRDQNMLIAQAELRVPLWWRFRAVVFGGAGDVARRLEYFGPGEVKWSGGGGLRFALSPEDRVHLRIDYGFGQDGSKLYITVNEAI